MSQYITPSNQTILWNVLQKIQLFQMVIPKNEQEMWFKQIIGNFYKQNKQFNLILTRYALVIGLILSG